MLASSLMARDPILEELERLRAEQMEKYQFDFDAFYRDLKKQEKQLNKAPRKETNP